MSARTMVSIFFLAAASFMAAGASAQDPTLHQVYQAAQSGNFSEAENRVDTFLEFALGVLPAVIDLAGASVRPPRTIA